MLKKKHYNYYLIQNVFSFQSNGHYSKKQSVPNRSHDVMEKAKSMLDWNGDAYSPSKVIEAVTIPKKTAVGVCVQGITIGSSEI